jgi:adenylate cyclase
MADAVGYSRLMSLDELGAVDALDVARAIFRSEIERHGGRIIDTAGDSVLAVFDSANGALNSALAVQRQLESSTAGGTPAERQMRFRIGIHLGDLIEKNDGTVYGDGVNIAARIQGLAQPGGIAISESVLASVRQHLTARLEGLGRRRFKNIAEPVTVYRVIKPVAAGRAAKVAALLRHVSSLKRLGWVVAVLMVVGVTLVYVRFAGTQVSADTSELPRFSVAILPFSLGHGIAPAFGADAFTSDLSAGLNTTLVPLGGSVAAHDAVSGARKDTADPQALGRKLQVRYLVEGELGATGESVTVKLSLIDVVSARQVWSGEVDTLRANIGESPALPVIRATQAVRMALVEAEYQRILKLPEQDRLPIDRVLIAFDGFEESSLKSLLKVRAACRQASQLDPKLADALLCIAATLEMEGELGPTPRYAELAREADDLTRRALALAPNNADAWDVRAVILVTMLHQGTAGLEANARAIQIDPTRTGYLEDRAFSLVLLGQPLEALPILDRATNINTSSSGRALRFRCRAYMSLGRFREAIESCERSASEAEYWTVHVELAAAYATLGDMRRASEARERTMARQPAFTLKWHRSLLRQLTDSPAHWEQFDANIAPGLRKAGFKEE